MRVHATEHAPAEGAAAQVASLFVHCAKPAPSALLSFEFMNSNGISISIDRARGNYFAASVASSDAQLATLSRSSVI